jgi:hypothetical protein
LFFQAKTFIKSCATLLNIDAAESSSFRGSSFRVSRQNRSTCPVFDEFAAACGSEFARLQPGFRVRGHEASRLPTENFGTGKIKLRAGKLDFSPGTVKSGSSNDESRVLKTARPGLFDRSFAGSK